MAKQHTQKTSSLPKSVAIGLSLVVLTLMLGLMCELPKSEPVYAGENIWTWDGISGNVETILSNPLNPSTAYAIVDISRLFKAIDNGKSWSVQDH